MPWSPGFAQDGDQTDTGLMHMRITDGAKAGGRGGRFETRLPSRCWKTVSVLYLKNRLG